MKLIASRRAFRVLRHRPRFNALMCHIVDGDGWPICGNRQINPTRWAEVPEGEVDEAEICKNCLRKYQSN